MKSTFLSQCARPIPPTTAQRFVAIGGGCLVMGGVLGVTLPWLSTKWETHFLDAYVYKKPLLLSSQPITKSYYFDCLQLSRKNLKTEIYNDKMTLVLLATSAIAMGLCFQHSLKLWKKQTTLCGYISKGTETSMILLAAPLSSLVILGTCHDWKQKKIALKDVKVKLKLLSGSIPPSFYYPEANGWTLSEWKNLVSNLDSHVILTPRQKAEIRRFAKHHAPPHVYPQLGLDYMVK